MALTPDEQNKVTLLLENDEVPNPYYGNEDSFKKVFDLIEKGCEQLIDKLQKTRS